MQCSTDILNAFKIRRSLYSVLGVHVVYDCLPICWCCACYRSGMLQAGDHLMAVNGKSVDGLTLTQAAELLKTSDEYVCLQIRKDPRLAGKLTSIYLMQHSVVACACTGM